MRRRQRAGIFSATGLAMLGIYQEMPTAGFAQNTVYFSASDPGVTKSVADWGIDTAWPNSDNVRLSVSNIGASNVDFVRMTFHPGQPLVLNPDSTYSLNATAKGYADAQLSLAAMAGSKPLTFLPGELASSYDAVNFVRTVKATQEYVNSKPGFTTTQIKSIETFNEPDWAAGQGSPTQLNSAITQLKGYAVFQNTAFPAGSTLNSNNAAAWYDPVSAATQGSSHLLGGSLTSWVNFIEHVKSTGKQFVNPELHSLGEAIVGAEHGMTGGSFWADALRARGLFTQASDGKRLGYYEDLGRQSAAAVYRAPSGKIYAFAGGLERFGSATAYRFVSTDSDVYFNGIGPIREYMLQTKSDQDGDFDKYGSWSNQGAYADIETTPTVPALDGYRWKMVNTATGQVMEVAGGGTDDGASIHTAADVNGLNQQWNIVRTRNGYYHLFNANSGRTAEVANLSLNNGAVVRQWGTADNQGQQWYIEDAGSGAFYVRNAFSNKYLTGSTSNNVQWDNLNSNVQRWKFLLSNPTSGPKAQYAFGGNVNSSTGSYHATASGNPTYASGPNGQGQAINLDGADDFVTLPSGAVSGADITVTALVKWNGGNAWQRIFDFGNNTTSYMFLTPKSGSNTMRFAITTGSNGAEQMLETDPLPVGQWVHLALTLGGNTGVLYVDGKPRVAGQILLNPDDVAPTLNYIGKSQWAADPLFAGAIDDFRIYDYALAQSQVANLVPNRWTGASSSSWTTASVSSPKNWQVLHSAATTDYTDGNTVIFDDSASSFTVNIADATVSPASVVFDHSAHDYALSGPGAIAGSTSLTKSGTRTLTVNNVNTYTGGTNIAGGTLALANTGSLGSGGINVSNGAVLDVAAGRGAAMKTPSLAVTSGASMDLRDNDLVTGTPKSTIENLVASARNGGAWNGAGITSSTARNLLTTGLGVLSGSEYTSVGGTGTFSGQTYGATDTLVKYTWNGDANFDGRVTFDDYVKIDTGFNTHLTGWLNGDFNYSGSVNFDDYVLIDIAFNQQNGTLSRAIDWISGDDRSGSGRTATGVGMVIEHFEMFGIAYGRAFLAAVPEPSSFALIVLSFGAAVRRVRRQRARVE